MAQENLKGFIDPGTPSLFKMPQLTPDRKQTTTSGTKKKEEDDDVMAMYGHTLTYELAKSKLSQERMAINAKLRTILKDDFGGDPTAFIQDKRVQNLMSAYSIKKASLAAARNSIQTEYKNYEEVRKEVQDKNAGDKYATGDSGQRLFVDSNGRMLDEGTKEGRSIPKNERQYITNNQLLEYNRKNLSVTQDDNGIYKVQTGIWSDPADYTKDAIGDFFYKQLGKSSDKYDSVQGTVTEGITPGGQGYLTNVNRKWNRDNLSEMSNWVSSNLSPEAKKQFMQKAWENGVFETDMRLIKAPKMKNGKYELDKNGNVVFEETVQTTTPEMIEKLKEKERNGTLEPWEKEWLNGENQIPDSFKLAKYTSDVASNYANGLTSDLYSQRISDYAGKGSDNGDEEKALLTKEGAIHAMLLTDKANNNKESMFVKTGKTDGDGNPIYQQQDYIGKIVNLEGNSLMEVLDQNEIYQSTFMDDEGEVIAGKLDKAVDLETMSNTFIWNGQAFNSSVLKGAKMVGRVPVVVGAPKMRIGQNDEPVLISPQDSDGQLTSEEMQSYYAYEFIVDSSEMDFFEENGINQKGEKNTDFKDNEFIKGSDVDSNPVLGWWGFQDSDEARALGIKEQSVDGGLSGDKMRVTLYLPANSTLINLHGDITKDRTHKSNLQNVTLGNISAKDKEEYESANAMNFYMNN